MIVFPYSKNIGVGGLLLLALILGIIRSAWASSVTIIYSSNLNGELEPCGCTEESDFGGIKRRATMVDRLRKENPDLILISAGGLLLAEFSEDRTKNVYILKGFALLDYDAIGVQWRDVAYGQAFLADYKLPLVASNWLDHRFFARERRITRSGYTLTFYQWLDPAGAPKQGMRGDHQLVSSNIQNLSRKLRQAQKEGTVTVLSSTLPLSRARTQLPLKNVDILIIRAKDEDYREPQEVDGTLVIQPGLRGMYLGRLDIDIDGKGNIVTWRHQEIPLPRSVVDSPRLQNWYNGYLASLRKDFRRYAAARKARRAGKSPFAGHKTCTACHPREYAVWQASKHAVAFEALKTVKKTFDQKCLGCHTVGSNSTGGFIDVEITPHLAGVQCESCHGTARGHVESSGTKPVTNATWGKKRMCVQCHTRRNSPRFKLGKYWPEVEHGSSAQPLKSGPAKPGSEHSFP